MTVNLKHSSLKAANIFANNLPHGNSYTDVIVNTPDVTARTDNKEPFISLKFNCAVTKEITLGTSTSVASEYLDTKVSIVINPDLAERFNNNTELSAFILKHLVRKCVLEQTSFRKNGLKEIKDYMTFNLLLGACVFYFQEGKATTSNLAAFTISSLAMCLLIIARKHTKKPLKEYIFNKFLGDLYEKSYEASDIKRAIETEYDYLESRPDSAKFSLKEKRKAELEIFCKEPTLVIQ